MLRSMAFGVAVLACACAPAPRPMAASEASEHLARFAAGADAGDVCTPQGRAVLRGAVRAYGAELAQAGVAWPVMDEGEAPRSVDLAVVLAFAGGLIEASDLQDGSRGPVSRFTLSHWPQLQNLRAAARLACAQMLELQTAATRLAAEMERYERLSARADPERKQRQLERLQRAQAQLAALAAAVEEEIAEAREGRG